VLNQWQCGWSRKLEPIRHLSRFEAARALYDICLYGYGGQATVNNQTYSYNCVFGISPNAQNPLTGQWSVTTAKTASSAGWSLTQWIEGDEYVVFRNVPVSAAGQNITITMSDDTTNPLGGYCVINGIQIVAKQ
jgi:hypothetical protein